MDVFGLYLEEFDVSGSFFIVHIYIFITCVTSTIYAAKAVYDVVRDIIKSRKQKSNRADQS